MQVKDIMCRQTVSIAPEASVASAARLLARQNIGALPVCSADGRLRGIVTDRDIVLRCVAADESPAELAVRDVMTRRLVCAAPEDPVALAMGQMTREQVRRLPVTENGRLVGMLGLSDLTARSASAMEAAAALSGICQNVSRR